VCLLVVIARAHPDAPLVVAANRDEWLVRPAAAMAVHRPAAPRILGGRDEVAGGTWLAVNEHGLVAALTNRPIDHAQIPDGRDGTRRSRGELPLLAAAHARARDAARALAATVRPDDYNPCWLLVGDRESLHYLELRPGAPLVPVELPPGVHVLENLPLGEDSAKLRGVRAQLAPWPAWRGGALVPALAGVLGDHGPPACVHAGPYGTRSATIVVVPPGAGAPPDLRFTPGPPCRTAFASAADRWRAS